jgi:hypothetical protein
MYKSIKDNSCQGKCHLKKITKTIEASKGENANNEALTKDYKFSIELFCESVLVYEINTIVTFLSKKISFYVSFMPQDIFKQIFHPPV